ncbi:MAG TPA: hypothetical protein PKI05_10905, partial [Thermogutta sp.]|nr:hypothetical protein [Thermogutta sp.]
MINVFQKAQGQDARPTVASLFYRVPCFDHTRAHREKLEGLKKTVSAPLQKYPFAGPMIATLCP